MEHLIIRLFFIFIFFYPFSGIGQYDILGKVICSESNIPLPYSKIKINNLQECETNLKGEFNFSTHEDSILIEVYFLGYKKYTKKVSIHSSKQLVISLQKIDFQLKEITINGNDLFLRDNFLLSNTNLIKLTPKDIKYLPLFGGDNDIIKAIQLTSGIQRGYEGGTDIYVRGGDADQNLVLMDEANLYNVGHLLSFFSLFNSDVIESVNLYKGNFNAEYGGRLSSILAVELKMVMIKKLRVQELLEYCHRNY